MYLLLTLFAIAAVIALLASINEVLPASVKLGSLNSSHSAANANYTRSQMAPTNLDTFPIRHTDWREDTAIATNLPAAATTGILGLINGTYGSTAPTIQTGDLHSAGASTRRARQIIELDHTYVGGGQINIVAYAHMVTNVADTSCTLLVEAYLLNDDGTLGSNIGPAAQSINSLTLAEKIFSINPIGLIAGDRLDVRISIAVTDAATGTAVTASIQSMYMNYNVQP